MRDEDDFSAYALARWPALVRAWVLLGSPPDEAHQLARTLLARLRSDWDRRDELGDLDEHTAQTLLASRHLDRKAPDPDAALVLQALLDVDGPASEADLESVRRDADAVVVEPLELDQVRLLDQQRRRARRRRTARVTTAVVLALAVVVGGWTWWATRPAPPPGLPDAPVTRVDNPAPVGWYTDDTLQLDQVALTVDDLQSFTQVRRGAVYADNGGEVILIETDGERTRLGTQAPDGAFATSEQDGLAAWVDVSGSAELHVYDLAERELVGTVAVDDSARVLAIDGGVVFVEDADGAYAVEHSVGWSALARMGPEGLLDVAGGASAFQDGPRSLLVTHDATRTEVPGTGAQLAPEGDYVLTRAGAAGGDVRGQVRIFDTIAGQEVDTGLTPDAQVYAAKLGGRGQATYLVELEQDEPDDGPRLSSSGSLQLVTCALLDPGLSTTCTVHRTFPRSSPWALAQ